MGFELYILPGGLFPRRVLIYLAEKNILQSSFLKVTPVSTTMTLKMTAPGKPPSSVPILVIGDGIFIKQSIAIIEYFEDLCDVAQFIPPYNPTADRELQNDMRLMREMLFSARKTMRGRTAEEVAKTREILRLADEATTYFSFACHKGSSMFSLMEAQSPATARFAMEAYRKTLALVEEYHLDDHRFQNGDGGSSIDQEFNATVADCVLFSLLQFAKVMYDVELAEGLPGLKRFEQRFERIDSANAEGHEYDENLQSLARDWIREKETMFGVVGEVLRVLYVYLKVLWRLVKPW